MDLMDHAKLALLKISKNLADIEKYRFPPFFSRGWLFIDHCGIFLKYSACLQSYFLINPNKINSHRYSK